MATDTVTAGAVERYLAYLKNVRCLSECTLAAYGKDLSHFSAYCGNNDIAPEDASSRAVEHFIADLSAEGIASVSVNRALSTLRGFYRYLIRMGGRKDDPAAAISNLKTPKTLPAFLWEGEMSAFAELPQKEGILWPLRDKALILVMYSGGLRISELVSLSIKNLETDLSGGRVIGKGDKERLIFFSDEAAAALGEYMYSRAERICAEKPTDKVFISRRGAPISIPGVRWIIGRYGDLSGLGKHIHPHALRHSFATHLVNSGCDVRLVQELLGHASISTTQRYTHVNMEKLKQVYLNSHPHAKIAAQGNKGRLS
ncbi:MAG: tyrosine-type recombinase/integrase [Treponema sp.]|nr:tyrosine-type recombinase/integrase [Treponema sp.]